MLGYCEAGIDCLKQHVRECPDFAESGECPNKFCKLPHVIRANRTRKPTSASAPAVVPAATVPTADDVVPDVAPPVLTVKDSQLGDEYISLTFNESEEDEESSDDDDDDEEEGNGSSPSDDDVAQD